MKGIIFDIRRYSVHDGKGIRTTVFLKGCPLNCIWCQNPEGINPRPQPVYYPTNCIGCKRCLALCKAGGMYEVLPDQETLLRENSQSALLRQNSQAAEDWPLLEYECPGEAIKVIGKEMSVEEVLQRVEKDHVFYQYGGGITISGGEPFYQSDFLLALLKECKKRNLHTAIETTLFTSQKSLDAVLPYLDQIYADFKIWDDKAHSRYVGAPNKKIKENIRYILTSKVKKRVIIRTPMIPGITATEENIRAISEFLSSFSPDVHYELLNYNPLGEPKYNVLQKNFLYESNPRPYTQEEMEEFRAMAFGKGLILSRIDQEIMTGHS